MPVFISFLRAINVGGNNKIPMTPLKVLFGDLGFKNATTLLQSGNVVFEAKSGTQASLGKKIAQGIRDRFDVEIDVVLRTPAELRQATERNPFPDAARDDPSHLLIMFLAATPTDAAAKALALSKFAAERSHLAGAELFIHYKNGIANSKLTGAFIEKTLVVRGTARNWNTVAKMIALSDELEAS